MLAAASRLPSPSSRDPEVILTLRRSPRPYSSRALRRAAVAVQDCGWKGGKGGGRKRGAEGIWVKKGAGGGGGGEMDAQKRQGEGLGGGYLS